MLSLPDEEAVLERLVAWGEADASIRALILTSSRARADDTVDLLSDYDLIVAVTDAATFAANDAWVSEYGQPLARWGDESELHGMRTSFRGVVYDDGVKVDYTIWPEGLLERVGDAESLPDALDVGYRVLLDKDGRTASWQAPTYRAHIPTKPTEAEYRALVEEFWWDTTYVAKALHRGEVVFAKFALDHDAKLGALRRFLEWRIELDHDWSLRPGAYGRGLEGRLPADIWSELAATYVGIDIEDNWNALFRTTALFRRVATEVGEALGYAYPLDVDEAVSAQLEGVRQLSAGSAGSRDHSCQEPG
ncbi:MAG: aminoglycoside 6-adenylyltransferase [Actinomycetota bacterium]|nr:aminoglycoside 6-adenylyltransferase [Actinomycetota bacterium]